jgi:hypothetical protein
MSNRAHPTRKKQAHPPTFVREALTPSELRLHGLDWIADDNIRKLSENTLANRQLTLDKLLWFLDRNRIDLCDTVALKRFLGYIGASHAAEGGRWGNAQVTDPSLDH